MGLVMVSSHFGSSENFSEANGGEEEESPDVFDARGYSNDYRPAVIEMSPLRSPAYPQFGFCVSMAYLIL